MDGLKQNASARRRHPGRDVQRESRRAELSFDSGGVSQVKKIRDAKVTASERERGDETERWERGGVVEMGSGQADARPRRDDDIASRAFGHRRGRPCSFGADEKIVFRRLSRPLRLRTFAPHSVSFHHPTPLLQALRLVVFFSPRPSRRRRPLFFVVGRHRVRESSAHNEKHEGPGGEPDERQPPRRGPPSAVLSRRAWRCSAAPTPIPRGNTPIPTLSHAITWTWTWAKAAATTSDSTRTTTRNSATKSSDPTRHG